MTPRQSPLKRKNPSGKTVWVARYKAHGKRRIAKPAWNGGKGSFDRKGDAQRAIDEALELAYGLGITQPDTLGNYAKDWTRRHPRSPRTNKTNDDRVGWVLDVEIEGRLLREYRFDELRRKHVLALVDHMLREQGRAVQGVRNILGSLSIMCENAIDDEVAGDNPFKGIRLRKTDPRAQKASKPIRVWSFGQMHELAAAAGRYEAMVRVLSDCGLRLGELLPLEREDFDGKVLRVHRTAHEGVVEEGTKTDHGEATPGRIVPVPPTLARLIAAQPPRLGTKLLFPTPTGKLWTERNFYRDVWDPARIAFAAPALAAKGIELPTGATRPKEQKLQLAVVRDHGLDPRPHECRHSYVSHLRAAGIDDADLAAAAGHTVETMIGSYTHALDRSSEAIREVIG